MVEMVEIFNMVKMVEIFKIVEMVEIYWLHWVCVVVGDSTLWWLKVTLVLSLGLCQAYKKSRGTSFVWWNSCHFGPSKTKNRIKNFSTKLV